MPKIYLGKKKASLTISAGKIGCPHAEKHLTCNNHIAQNLNKSMSKTEI